MVDTLQIVIPIIFMSVSNVRKVPTDTRIFLMRELSQKSTKKIYFKLSKKIKRKM